eukprot:GILI01025106.1.p1 GENE.GILI01025106.1~~GILI01025106.1.p1  ORF type:complete len:440 (+),score=77.59 GILI01025106.1:48-1367(+)
MITVEGYSGCEVRIVKDQASSEYVVEKCSHDPKYIPRLIKQRDKQRMAHRNNTSPNVVVPNIIFTRLLTHEDHTAEASQPVPQSITVGMPFLHHTDSVSFLMKASMAEVKMFSECLLDSIEGCVSQCGAEAGLCDISIFIEKLDDIAAVCGRNKCIQRMGSATPTQLPPLERIQKTIIPTLAKYLRDKGQASRHIRIPLGTCHGDFTLSNVLVLTPLTGDGLPLSPRAQSKETFRIALIDFLDSFVESPLADMAKLCQDLKYGWTLRLMSTPSDPQPTSPASPGPCKGRYEGGITGEYVASLAHGLPLKTNEDKSVFAALRELDEARPWPISEAAAKRRRLLLHSTAKEVIRDTKQSTGASDFQSGAVQVFAAMHYIYEAMVVRYAGHEWFRDYFLLFFIMNQLRVLQYSKDTEAALYLYRTVEEEYKLFENNGGQVSV